MSAEGERLQKVLAKAGVGSRRAVEELISQGRIKVNGRRAELGRRVDPQKDEVEVDGSRVPLNPVLAYYLVNKPAGIVTTAHDERGRPTVLELVDPSMRLWPVGRLDADTEGALVLTNDGELTFRLSHPRFGVEKTYLAEVRGSIARSALKQLASGLELSDGMTAPAQVRLVERIRGGSLIEMSIVEGRNRQVRRMLEHVGHPVGRLVRTAIGPVGLGRLKPGTWRRLSGEEVRALYRACKQVDLATNRFELGWKQSGEQVCWSTYCK